MLNRFLTWLTDEENAWRLARLDDRLLKDIGIPREEIRQRVTAERVAAQAPEGAEACRACEA